jgi:hypothetical protein
MTSLETNLMFNAPASVWNAIAETQDLRTGWAQQMFPLPQDSLDLAVQNELDRVANETGSKVLAAAYLLVMPLLWEAKAIRAWTAQSGPQGSLPPVETVDQAMAIAQGDFLLEPQERKTLRAMLLVEPQE